MLREATAMVESVGGDGRFWSKWLASRALKLATSS